MNKSTLIFSAVVLAAVPVLAGVYGDTPDACHAWAVHDRNRPNPVKVTAEPGRPPSDAVVLFDGTEESFRKNWCHVRENRTGEWRVVDGAMESVKGAGYIATKQAFGDCQLHIEWQPPQKIEGVGQGRGNSGVFLMGNYEIQVLDSYETDPSKDPNPNPNYADGQAGAVYAENPPLVNPARPNTEWQTYDIVFHQPVWEGETMLHPGSVTVFFNGVLVQDHWEMEGLTTHCRRRPLKPHAKKLPFQLQDHGNPVHFRNIWIREIPSRWDNTTHCVMSAKPGDVMALRRSTAAKLFAKIEKPVKPTTANMQAVGEVISYAREGEYLATWQALAKEYREGLEKKSDAELAAMKGELMQLLRTLETLIRNKAVPETCQTRAKIREISGRLGWEKK